MTTSPLPAATAGLLTRRRALQAAGSVATLAALPAALTACGGGELLIVPFITFQFEGVVPVDGGANLQVVTLALDNNGTQQGKSSGSFDGPTMATQNRAPTATATQSPTPSGTFSGASLSLSVPGAVAPLDTAYDGRFVEADTIQLTPKNAGRSPIRLLRADSSFRPKLDASTWQGTDASGKAWTLTFQTNPQFDDGATELLAGTDALAGQPAGTLTGYATMRRLEITITRGAAAPVALSGRMGPTDQTPPKGTDLAPATTITFDDGSKLARTSPTPA